MGEFSPPPPPPYSEPPSFFLFFSYPSNFEIIFDFSDNITKIHLPFQNPGSALESTILAPFIFKIKMWQVLKTSCWILLRALLRSTVETDEILKFTFSTGILSCRRDRLRRTSGIFQF